MGSLHIFLMRIGTMNRFVLPTLVGSSREFRLKAVLRTGYRIDEGQKAYGHKTQLDLPYQARFRNKPQSALRKPGTATSWRIFRGTLSAELCAASISMRTAS